MGRHHTELGTWTYLLGVVTLLCQPFSSDHDLQRTALRHPKIRSVDVILGGRDCVIRPAMIELFLAEFSNINIVQMEDLGHDPFEEDADSFVKTVQCMIEHRCRLEQDQLTAATTE